MSKKIVIKILQIVIISSLAWVGFALEIGSQWQQEIAVINIANGWDWTFSLHLFEEWNYNNWQAYDFWRLVMDLISIATCITLCYYLIKCKILELKLNE